MHQPADNFATSKVCNLELVFTSDSFIAPTYYSLSSLKVSKGSFAKKKSISYYLLVELLNIYGTKWSSLPNRCVFSIVGSWDFM
jgi:hypothetical protein